jgi:hypothetical protein
VAKADPFGGRHDLDPVSLVSTLERFEVDYVAIGGIAAIAHGVQRITRDLDVLIDRSEQNCRRLIAALASLDAEICLDAHRRTRLDERADPGWLARGEHFFDTRAGGIDVRDRVPGSRPYGELRSRAVRLQPTQGLQITVAARNDLLAMKRASGRDQDLADVREIEAVAELEDGP